MRSNRWNRAQEACPPCVDASGSVKSVQERRASVDIVADRIATKLPSEVDDNVFEVIENPDWNWEQTCENRAESDARQCNIKSKRSIQKQTASPTEKASRQQKNAKKLGLTESLDLFTCGCGEVSADCLCELLFQFGIRSVLDVRALPKSKRKPWFNSDSLAKTMHAAGLMYNFVGKGRKSHTVVAAHVQRCEQPVCLLGFRASALECSRLLLSEKLLNGLGWKLMHLEPSFEVTPPQKLTLKTHTNVFGKYRAAMEEIARVQNQMERKFGFTGHWRARVLAGYSSVHYEEWDQIVSSTEPTAIQLPWGSVLIVLPQFICGSGLQRLQQDTLPGALRYEQPRRRVMTTHGSFAMFTQQHKEAWLCDDYGYADPTRACPPREYQRHKLPEWALGLIEQATHAASMPFNAMMCRWEPPGEFADEGPHTFARGSPMPEYTVVGMLGVHGSRHLRVHGLGCWEKLSVDIPIHAGSLVIFGGPLKERWLFVHLRDKGVRGERVLITLQLHADSTGVLHAVQGTDSKGSDWSRAETDLESRLTSVTKPTSASAPKMLPDGLCKARWRRSDKSCQKNIPV